jgi:hypothetical protein
MTEQDKEKILQTIVSQGSRCLTAFNIHQALPQYGEEELGELLLDMAITPLIMLLLHV